MILIRRRLKKTLHSLRSFTIFFAGLLHDPGRVEIKRMIMSNQTDKNGEAMVYINLRGYDPLKRKDIKEKKSDQT